MSKTLERKVECLYTEYFFKTMYDYAIKTKATSIIDYSDTVWELSHIEEILIEDFGLILQA